MSKLEKLKAIHTLKKDLSQDQVLDLLKKLGVQPDEYNNRIKGLDRENEFLMVLKSLDITKSIIKIDEAPNKLFNMNTSDIEVVLTNGSKWLIEIKSRNIQNDTKIEFTNNYLDALEKFSIDREAELLFVVCIMNFWMAFRLSYIRENKNVISLDDYNHSVLDIIFGLRSYVFFKGIEIKTVYSKSKKDSLIKHHKYGGLVSQLLMYRGRKIYKYSGKSNIFYVVCCEEIHNRLDVINITTEGDYTIEIKGIKNSEAVIIQEIDMVLSTIEHSVDENNESISIDEEVNQHNKNNKHYIMITQFRAVFDILRNMGLYYLIMRDSKLYDK